MRVAYTVATIVLAPPVLAAASPQEPAAAAADDAATPATPLPPLTGPRPQEDTLTAADEAPGSRNVAVTFSENFIAARLPFDVPFNVTGTVATTVKRLDLTVYRVSTATNLARLLTDLRRTRDCGEQNPPGNRVSESSATPAPDGRFSAFVNALDPQYFYALCFVGVTPVNPTEIEGDARRILIDAVPQLTSETDITFQMLAQVRSRMSARIAAIGAARPDQATIPPGNLFDPRVANNRPFGQRVAAIRGPLGNMAREFGNYNTRLELFRTTVAAARTGPAGPLLTEGILAALPLSNNRLPSVQSAISENTAFDFDAYGFEDARTLLRAAASGAAATPANQAVLADLADKLDEVARVGRFYGRLYDDTRTAAVALLSFIALEAREVNVALGSSALGADLNRSAYVSLDAGIAYPWRLESMVFYAGTNIYFRPINKAAPLRYKGTFLHRFALTVGITSTVTDESRRASDLRTTDDGDDDTSNSLLLGAGFRVTPSMRVGGGVLVFKESDPNPLIDQTSVAITPYIAFAADINVAEIFRSLF